MTHAGAIPEVHHSGHKGNGPHPKTFDLGALLVLKALGAPPEAYGQASIICLNDKIEHQLWLVHALAFGNYFRDAADAATLLPAVEKRGPAGVSFDIPLQHITDPTICSHHQSMDVEINDTTHQDEIVITLAAAGHSRPQQCLADLKTEAS